MQCSPRWSQEEKRHPPPRRSPRAILTRPVVCLGGSGLWCGCWADRGRGQPCASGAAGGKTEGTQAGSVPVPLLAIARKPGGLSGAGRPGSEGKTLLVKGANRSPLVSAGACPGPAFPVWRREVMGSGDGPRPGLRAPALFAPTGGVSPFGHDRI